MAAQTWTRGVAADTSLGGPGLAWAAGQVWRDVDPDASLVAGDRALERMHELRPDVTAERQM